ncbi:hypothetical protein WN73_07055 [Bradyrhizobium sp. CCBAU 45394]|nr:hypothetical protein [Bradyrhizobium sp. CCBAU 45394]
MSLAPWDRNPLPAFASDLFRLELQLVGDKAIQQGNVLQISAIVMLEQITQDAASGLFVGLEANEPSAAIGRADRLFCQQAPDLVGLVVARSADLLPDLLLASRIGSHRERHELLERHAVLGIDLVQPV